VHALEDEDGEVELRDGDRISAVVERFSPEVIFHLGGISGPMVSPDDPVLVSDVNCLGTVNMLEAACRAGVPRFVYASSVSGYDGGNFESSQPLSVYGATKRFGEMVLSIYRREERILTTSARIGSVYGVGRFTVDIVGRMIDQAIGEGRIDYRVAGAMPLIHVDDLVRYLIALGASEDPPEACDLVTQTATEEELARMIAAALGHGREILRPLSVSGPTFPRHFTADIGGKFAGIGQHRLLLDSLGAMIEEVKARRPNVS
jgi:nucleoside-diphosphate-sugar epimerase